MPARKNSHKARRRFYALIIISLILFSFSIWGWVNKPIKTEIIDVKFIIGESIGFSINQTELNFGKVTPGGSATRKIIVENDYDAPIRIEILVSNNIANFIFSEKDYVVPAKNTTKIPITLVVPEHIDYGNYSGKIKIESYKL